MTTRADFAFGIRDILGDRLRHHQSWDSVYDYSAKFDSRWVVPDKYINHHNGYWAQLPVIYNNAKIYGAVEAENIQARKVEHTHLSKVPPWRGAAYGFMLCPITGEILEMRSFFMRWGAHRGDIEGDGIPENDEGIPIYWPTGSLDALLPAPLLEAHDALIGALVELTGIPFTNQWVHKDIEGGTTCAGPLITPRIDAIREGMILDVISQGATGSSVRKIQKRLKRHGYELEPDGIFGPMTAQAVKDFQSSIGIDVTGSVDFLTSDHLMRKPKGDPQ